MRSGFGAALWPAPEHRLLVAPQFPGRLAACWVVERLPITSLLYRRAPSRFMVPMRDRKTVDALHEPLFAQRGEAATDRSAPVPGRSNVGSLAVWEHSRASSQASLAAAGTAALLREISSQLANDFDHCSAGSRIPGSGDSESVPDQSQPCENSSAFQIHLGQPATSDEQKAHCIFLHPKLPD